MTIVYALTFYAGLALPEARLDDYRDL